MVEVRPGRGERLRTTVQNMMGSARVRILAWMLLLVAITLTVTSSAMAVVLTKQTEERVNERLFEEVAEFRRYVETYREPPGHPTTDVRELLESALNTILPDEHQVFLALVDGAVLGPPRSDPALVLAGDPVLVARFAATDRPAYGEAITGVGRIRYAAVPVVVESQGARGTFVVAAFVEGERAEILEAIRADLLIGLGAILVAAALGWLFAGRLLAPLRLLRITAASINETDLSQRIPVSGDHEIARLAVIFNGMLDRLADAFAAQRQFIDDASHEMRTPITIIRANIELLEDDPAQRPERIAQVIDELDRMNRMVEDLLVLAKTRRPDFLRLEAVEFAEIVEDAFVKSSALAHRRWLLEQDDEGETAVLRADRQRLIQALVQLAQNAVQHTGEGSAITVGSSVEEGIGRIWVTDTGLGVEPEQERQIFDRFHRASPGRQATGAGLGLAIVNAIAEAHGGSVELDNRPGDGATFTLVLPVEERVDAVPAGGPRSGGGRVPDQKRAESNWFAKASSGRRRTGVDESGRSSGVGGL
ncbi:sensor histidine kinase [Saccharopolyspora mangrovi]|uniref:histidine kinase n=1 Tax=Saccharopolyspora mangrovi TaxID=3082379 RepID=A0ABU6A4B2_9PSEU|nr:HAMP domain-containing sensor histidine kinase [Saccharopolyspora sp. S2-29]MEB3366402.1 HAMP domain-containing sensor histidine kinase [Saccharopolyspora sp. S2-29]